jgi:hypothetical protein
MDMQGTSAQTAPKAARSAATLVRKPIGQSATRHTAVPVPRALTTARANGDWEEF